MKQDINIGALSEALNNKADRDLLNTSSPYPPPSKAEIFEMIMPDYNNGETRSLNILYTAETSGWLRCSQRANADRDHNMYLSIDGGDSFIILRSNNYSGDTIMFPIEKNCTYKLTINGNQSTEIIFYPIKRSNVI